MHELFYTRSPIQYARTTFPEFDLVRQNYQIEVEKIKAYYRDRAFTLSNDHVLVQLLKQLELPLQYTTERSVELAQARAAYVAANAKLTSEIRTGSWFDGVFYGPECHELLLQIETYINPAVLGETWRSLCPVRVLWHTQSNLSLLPPIGRRLTSDNEYAVIAIDVALLALQYHQYRLNQQLTNSTHADVIFAAPIFLRRYVLPHMLERQLDIAIINRLINLSTGAPMGVAYARLPFAVRRYETAIDVILKKCLHLLDERSLKYEAMLRLIPSVFTTDAQAVLRLPDVALTRQIFWAIIFSRLRICRFLVDIGGEKGKSQNQLELTKLRRTLRLLDTEHRFDTVIPSALQYDTQRHVAFFLE